MEGGQTAHDSPEDSEVSDAEDGTEEPSGPVPSPAPIADAPHSAPAPAPPTPSVETPTSTNVASPETLGYLQECLVFVIDLFPE